MSFPALAWACEQELPAMQKIVLVCLAHRMNHKTRRCDPSMERLAKDAGMSLRSVVSGLAALEKSGKVKRELRAAGGMKVSNAYTLMFADVQQVHDVVKEMHNDVQDVHPGNAGAALAVVQELHINKEVLTGKENKEILAPSSQSDSKPDRGKLLGTFPCVGKGAREFSVFQVDADEWQEAYPGVDVRQELRAAKMWLMAHRKRQKTARGMPAFLVAWFSRQQNSGGSNGFNQHATPIRGRYPTREEQTIQAVKDAVRDCEQADRRAGFGSASDDYARDPESLFEWPGRILEGGH